MKRHRHDEIGRLHRHARPELGEQVSQRNRQASAALELEGVQGLACDLVVANRGTRIGKRGRPAPAPATEVRVWPSRVGLDRLDAREGPPADPTGGRRDALEASPTPPAQRIAASFLEAPLAYRTEWGKDEIQQRSDPTGPACPKGDRPLYGRAVFQRRH